MNPRKTYFDPLTYTHEDTDLDIGLESLYSLESLGINEEKYTGSIDSVFTKKISDSIVFQNGKYHVEIPWYKETLERVPSNHHIALALLRRIKQNLRSNNLDTEYGDVFKQYEEQGIIERITVSREDYNDYVWIPHHPVIKEAEQVTTKI